MHNYSNREKRNEVMIGGYPYFQITMYQKLWNNISYFLLELNLNRLSIIIQLLLRITFIVYSQVLLHHT